ncbi:MAG: hypothetical protein OXC60_17660 [Litoreibacter sp.]|nr:hypothetical protein [Litoreibacter sp.]
MIKADSLPQDALLGRYADRPECYTDCFSTVVDHRVLLEGFVTAFYTARLFRSERFVLAHTVRRPSTDAEASEFAAGQRDKFAAWDMEARTDDQPLACDLSQATRSWFKVEPQTTGTKLYFGSAVTPKQGGELGIAMKLATPLHRVYSRLLLAGARNRLSQDQY